MSAITPGALQGAGSSALNLYQQTSSALAGHPDLVHFIDVRTNACIFQFDAVINEQHSRESTVTSFPVESGQTVTDHVIVAPAELTVQGIITDSPIGNAKALITEAIASGFAVAASPLQIAAAGALYGAATTYQADQGQSSPCQAAFAKLQLLQGGDPEATPPVPPSLIHVHSKLKLYKNMVIKSLSIPRDKTVSNAIIVQISLVKLNLVRPQTISVTGFSNEALAASVKSEGEKATGPTGVQIGIGKINKIAVANGYAPVQGGA